MQLMKQCKQRNSHSNILVNFCLLGFILCSSNSRAEQRLEMDGTAIIGNKELPKVLYIVPWKASQPVTLSTPAFKSVLEENFQTVDRSTFKRQLELYNSIYASPDISQ